MPQDPLYPKLAKHVVNENFPGRQEGLEEMVPLTPAVRVYKEGGATGENWNMNLWKQIARGPSEDYVGRCDVLPRPAVSGTQAR